ncbi:cytohesin-interacting protein [Astyanax mexicanus]|uniref:cytohesin-interacting protein n=1 Tax=Astyanax mexicanus TaxID=7994 RepID=UPI0020CAD1F6|nr:cytohesin-interacting protein [Astyanax mexicanus]
MSINMNRKPALQQQRSLDTYILDSNSSRKSVPWRWRSLNNGKQLKNGENSGGTLPRGRNQLNRMCSNSLVDYTDPQRTTVVLEKQDNEAYGFEVQTYGLQLRNSNEVEMCTFVSSVQEGCAAESAGLTAGDIILTVNGVSIKGFSHQQIIELIRESINMLKMETVSGSVVKRIELEKRMRLLKQTLHEKWVELKALTLQEKRLTRGNLSVSSQHPSMDSLMSISSPTGRCGQRFSSDSSCLSVLTDDSEDLLSPVFDEYSQFSPTDPNREFFSKESQPDWPSFRPTLTRTRSISSGSSRSTCQSPTWDNARASSSAQSSVFGTLPRRGRKASMRKHILKFIPGLNHSVEEEEAT